MSQLQALILTRLQALGDRGQPMSHREAARRTPGAPVGLPLTGWAADLRGRPADVVPMTAQVECVALLVSSL